MALSDGSGPDGHVYTTYSDISGLRFGVVIAAAFLDSYSYSLTVQHSGLGDSVSLNQISVSEICALMVVIFIWGSSIYFPSSVVNIMTVEKIK